MRLIKAKKAQEPVMGVWVVGISIAVFIAIVLVYFVVNVAHTYPSTLDKEVCHDSVLARASWLKGTHITPEIMPLKCKTQNIEIKTGNEETIKEDVANAMYDCWWMLGEGKIDFLTDANWWDISNPLGLESRSCIICSELKFRDAAFNKNIDMANYLNIAKVPNKNMTYLEYFSGGKTVLPVDAKISPLTTSQDYAIILFGMKGAQKQLRDAGYMGAASGAAIGGLTGTLVGAGYGAGVCLVGTVTAPLAPLCAVVGGIIGGIGGGVGGGAVGGTAGGIVGTASLAANAYFASMYCDGKTGGCFNMLLVPATPESLEKYCKSIESIP